MLNFLRKLLGLPTKPSLRKVSEEVRQSKEVDTIQGLVVRISESEHIDARYSVLQL